MSLSSLGKRVASSALVEFQMFQDLRYGVPVAAPVPAPVPVPVATLFFTAETNRNVPRHTAADSAMTVRGQAMKLKPNTK